MSQALPGQATPEGVPSFKLVLVGDGGTGTVVLVNSCCVQMIPGEKSTGVLQVLKHGLEAPNRSNICCRVGQGKLLS